MIKNKATVIAQLGYNKYNIDQNKHGDVDINQLHQHIGVLKTITKSLHP